MSSRNLPQQHWLLLMLPLLALAASDGKAVAVSAAEKSDISTLPSTGAEVLFERCPQGDDWVHFKDACYWWSRNVTEYWYVAEQRCIALGGHLTSIVDNFEDSYIAKLTYCRSTWLGRYAVNVDRLGEANNYRWTDGANSQYHEHDFKYPDIHYPLISAENLRWKNNVYHGRHPYVCKVKTLQRNYTCDCPNGWRELNGYCYLMPSFNATYIEADFYCRGRDAFVTSIQNERELRAMSLLDIDSYGCPAETWIGLLKLNPCRADFSTGGQICYRWSDRSGDYKGLPAWQAGSPSDDRVTNCVLLQNEEIRTVPCYTRARFVCKKKVEPRLRGRPCPAVDSQQ